jgi:hypothetical protein
MRLLTGILNGTTFLPICGPTEKRLAHRAAFKSAVGPGEVIIFQQVKHRTLVGQAQTPPDKVIAAPMADKSFGRPKAR